jgi:hypothetical protein
MGAFKIEKFVFEMTNVNVSFMQMLLYFISIFCL